MIIPIDQESSSSESFLWPRFLPIPQRIIITASPIPIAANIELISGPELSGSNCTAIHSPSSNIVPSPHAASNTASLSASSNSCCSQFSWKAFSNASICACFLFFAPGLSALSPLLPSFTSSAASWHLGFGTVDSMLVYSYAASLRQWPDEPVWQPLFSGRLWLLSCIAVGRCPALLVAVVGWCFAVGTQRRSVGLVIIKIRRLRNLPATILQNSKNYSVLFTESKNIIPSSRYR